MRRCLAATVARSVVGVAILLVFLTTDIFAQHQFKQPNGRKTGLRPGVCSNGRSFGLENERQTLYESKYYRKQIGGALESTYDRLSLSQGRLREAQSDADYATKSWLSADERAFRDEELQEDAAGRLKAATKRLRAIEAATLAAQRDESPFGRLRAAVRRGVANLKAAEHLVLASSEYRRRRAAVDAGSARPIDLVQLRRRLLESDAACRRIKTQLAQLKRQMDVARAVLFRNNPDWQATTDQIAQARQAKSASRRSLSRSLRDRSRADSALRRAQNSAAAEQQSIDREGRRVTSLRISDQALAEQQRRILSGRAVKKLKRR